MRHRSVIQLEIEYDDLYAPPDKWDWPALLDLDDTDKVTATIIEAPSLIDAEVGQTS